MRLSPRPVSIDGAGSGVRTPGRVLVVLHEDEVPVLQEALVLAAGQVVGACRTRRRGRGRARCTGRTGRSGRPARSSPSAGTGRSARAGRRSPPRPRSPPRRRPSPSSSSPSKTVIQMSSASKPNPFSDSSQANSTAPSLKYCADREVAEHLEEREVPRGVADVLDVGRAKALLAARQQRRRRRLETEEVALERVHSGRREQHRLVERRGHERCRRQALVAALLEEPQEASRGSRPTSCSWRDRRTTHDDIAPQQHRGLAGRDAPDRLGERQHVAVEDGRRRASRGSAASRVSIALAGRCSVTSVSGTRVRRSAARGPTVTVFATTSVAVT